MDNSSRIRKLIMDLMDNGELRMCSVTKERSGSLLLKVRIGDLNNEEDGCVGAVSLNSNIHFRRKSQKQFKRDVNRSEKHKSDLDQTCVSSRTRSKIELARSCNSPESDDDISKAFFYGAASPDTCHDSSAHISPEVQQTVSAGDSPNPMDLFTMRENVNSDCSIPVHRVDSLPDSCSPKNHSAASTEDVTAVEIDSVLKDEQLAPASPLFLGDTAPSDPGDGEEGDPSCELTETLKIRQEIRAAMRKEVANCLRPIKKKKKKSKKSSDASGDCTNIT